MPASSAYLFICCHFPGADLFCSHGIFLCLSFACCTYLLVLPYKIPQAGGLDNKCVPCISKGWESESRMLAGWPLWLAGGMFSCVCLWSFLSSCTHVFFLNFLFLPVELGPTYTKLYNLICFFKVLEIVTFWGTQEEDFLVSTHSPSHHSVVAGAYRCSPVWGSGCWAYKRMAFMLPSQEVGTRLVWGTIQLSGSYMLLSLIGPVVRVSAGNVEHLTLLPQEERSHLHWKYGLFELCFHLVQLGRHPGLWATTVALFLSQAEVTSHQHFQGSGKQYCIWAYNEWS